ncbi:hypothetical protein RRG08_013394 [Elysia crispata]|uniref:Uncharacterized protein n=1 Tax=Elysia crispata TaxID=231223 RepID=A0AAE1B6U7_9GAST|nr:hypothetical protein RRG08_013394 [Elysia crispata]
MRAAPHRFCLVINVSQVEARKLERRMSVVTTSGVAIFMQIVVALKSMLTLVRTGKYCEVSATVSGHLSSARLTAGEVTWFELMALALGTSKSLVTDALQLSPGVLVWVLPSPGDHVC